jgi:hypothetical protein
VTTLDSRVPLEEWCNAGLSLIKFPIDAEYAVLNQILETANGHSAILIHSKPLRDIQVENITTIDATGHALTAQTVLRQRIRASDDDSTLENPEDIQSILSQLQKRRRSQSDTEWWVWWSPSDLVAHDIDESEIVRCMRALANEFSDTRFLVLVAKDVHSKQTLARLEYVSEMTVDVNRVQEKNQIKHQWQVRKHPDTKLEGIEVIV